MTNCEFFYNLVKDLIKADNTMSLEELYTHCKIIGEHNGYSETELRNEWEELVKLKGKEITSKQLIDLAHSKKGVEKLK